MNKAFLTLAGLAQKTVGKLLHDAEKLKFEDCRANALNLNSHYDLFAK